MHKKLIFFNLCIPFFIGHTQVFGESVDPLWWTQKSVINDQPEENFKTFNIGQFKHMITQAEEALSESLGQDSSIDLGYYFPAVPQEPDSSWHEEQYMAVNVGQLKHLARPFYDRLNDIAPGWLSDQMVFNEIPWVSGQRYPWDENAPIEENYALAIIGQLKAMFALRFDTLHSYVTDEDNDGLFDSWEMLIVDHDNSDSIVSIYDVDPLHDYDQDGFSNELEYENGTDPVRKLLSENSVLEVYTRLAGQDVSQAINAFTTYTNSNYVRNPNCWLSDLEDITCMSPWNSRSGKRRAGTLISPRHVIYAAHFPLSQGNTVHFVDLNNNIITRTITATKVHPLRVSNTDYDIGIALLDSDVPTEIKHAKVLPDNWADYHDMRSNRLPVMQTNQREEFVTADLARFGIDDRFNNSPYVAYSRSKNPVINTFYQVIADNDSGNPSFLLIDSKLVILSVHTSFFGVGTSISDVKDAINLMMSEFQESGGYQLEEVDLSSFTKLEDL